MYSLSLSLTLSPLSLSLFLSVPHMHTYYMMPSTLRPSPETGVNTMLLSRALGL
jgi:hypothetical protein